MWNYERRLLYPVKIKNKNPRLAQIVLSQYGGPYRSCLSGFIITSKTRI